jgi:hypothetical protein
MTSFIRRESNSACIRGFLLCLLTETGSVFRPRQHGAGNHKDYPTGIKHITYLATHIQNAPQQVPKHATNTLAQKTASAQRQRKLTGSTFAQLMGFDTASTPCPTYTN